ncbi:hypothetical protein, partial [Pseudomonas aeruginosa]
QTSTILLTLFPSPGALPILQLQATWRQWCRSHAPAGTALRADPLPGAGR